MFINRDEYLCKVPRFWRGCSSAGVIWPLLPGWAVRWLRGMEVEKGLRVGLLLAGLLWIREDLPGGIYPHPSLWVKIPHLSHRCCAHPSVPQAQQGGQHLTWQKFLQFFPKTPPSLPGPATRALCAALPCATASTWAQTGKDQPRSILERTKSPGISKWRC